MGCALHQGHSHVHQRGWGAGHLTVASRQAGPQVGTVRGCAPRAWPCQQSHVTRSLFRGLHAKAQAVDPIEVVGCEVSAGTCPRKKLGSWLPTPSCAQPANRSVWCSLFFRKSKLPFSKVLPKYLGNAISAGMNDKV